MTEKANRIGKKYDKEEGGGGGTNQTFNINNDEG